jgi:NADP-dependent 3-hydroxy acid dehydrogenase YdfG
VFKIPEELAEYTKALDWVINNTGAMPREMVQELGEGKWVVWMTWADVRGFIPKTPIYPGDPGR